MIYNANLTALFKEIVKDREGLYDTGALWESIIVSADFSRVPSVRIEIIAKDYLKYYIVERALEEQFTEDPVFVAEYEEVLEFGIRTGKLPFTIAASPAVGIISYIYL